ncbi:MAG: FAD-dependent oxidoreductase [Planctomycetaceae bacterium]
MRYDLIVIGDTDAACEGALVATKLNKRVALVERRTSNVRDPRAGSAEVPLKTLRDAVVRLTALQAPVSISGKRQLTLRDVKRQVVEMVDGERAALERELDRRGVIRHRGEPRFAGPNEVIVGSGDEATRLEADYVLIACGTKPLRPERVPFDGRRVITPDELLKLDSRPHSLLVLGGGPTGLGYALCLAHLGVRVSVVDERRRLLEFCDDDVVEMLRFEAHGLGVEFHLGDEVIGFDEAPGDRIALVLCSGRRLMAERMLYAGGRVGVTDRLNLPAIGLEPDERGKLWCDGRLRTWAQNVYGAGDVVGFPARSDIAVESGRRAVCHAFGVSLAGWHAPAYSLPTIPEARATGETEEQLREEWVPYEMGVAHPREPARVTAAPSAGLVKLLFHRGTRKLLGAHCVGTAAGATISIAQGLMAREGTLDELAGDEAPAAAIPEALRLAARDGLSRLIPEAVEPVREQVAPPAPVLSRVARRASLVAR